MKTVSELQDKIKDKEKNTEAEENDQNDANTTNAE